MKVKRIRSEEEYKTGGNSDFISLDEKEKFVGYALFDGDPKIDELGFFPYKMHWNGKTSVPCADDDCIFCEDGDRPRSKAYSLWLVVIDEAGKKLGKGGEGELRIFDMPVTVIKQINELRAEGDAVKGMQFRVARTDEKTYVLVPKSSVKPLTKKQVSELLKSSDAPDFEGMLTNKLKKAMEGVAVARALEDDDDEEPRKSGNKATKKTAKGKGKVKDEEPEDDETETETEEETEWPDDGLDEETVIVTKVEKKGQWIEVESDKYEDTIKVWTTDEIETDLTDFSKGDEVTITTSEKDDDGEYVLTEEPVGEEPNEDPDDDEENEEGGGGDDDLPESIEDDIFEVVNVDAGASTMDVKNDDLEFTLFFLDTMKVDFDDYEEGAKIKVSAEKDRAGDLVATEIPEIQKAKKSGGKGASKKKTPAKKKAGKGKK